MLCLYKIALMKNTKNIQKFKEKYYYHQRNPVLNMLNDDQIWIILIIMA